MPNDMSFVYQSFSSGQNFQTMSDAQLKEIASNVAGVSHGDADKIYAQLLVDRQEGATENVSTLIGLLSSEKPGLQPPKAGDDPVKANLEFQHWLTNNQTAFGTISSTSDVSYIVNLVAQANAEVIPTPTISTPKKAQAGKMAGLPTSSTTTTTNTKVVITPPGSGTTTTATASVNSQSSTSGGTFSLPPGGKTTTAADGTATTDYSDGTVIVQGKDGTVSTTTPDGTKIVNTPDGMSKTTFPDGQVVTGPTNYLPPATQNVVNNTIQTLNDTSDAVHRMLDAIPASNTSAQAAELKNFLKNVLSAIDKLRGLLRQMQAGNSEKAQQLANSRMKTQLDQIKKQIEQQEAAEKAGKKQATMSLVMNIVGPILLVVAVAATLLTGGLAGPFLAITVALFVASIADQITNQVTGQGMFSMAFAEISKNLPPGVAMAVKAVILIAIIAAAVFAPSNTVVALGLAFSMVSSSGIIGDATTVAQQNGMSDSGVQALSWTLTAGMAVGSIAAMGVAGSGAASGAESAAETAASTAADAGEDAASTAASTTSSATTDAADAAEVMPQQGDDENISLLDKVKSKAMEQLTGKAADGSKADMATWINYTGVGVHAGSELVQAATQGGQADVTITQAAYQKQQLALQAEIDELEQDIKLMEQTIQLLLTGGNMSQWIDTCTQQIDDAVKGQSSNSTSLAQASHA